VSNRTNQQRRSGAATRANLALPERTSSPAGAVPSSIPGGPDEYTQGQETYGPAAHDHPLIYDVEPNKPGFGGASHMPSDF
jgi:hypothetical protein